MNSLMELSKQDFENEITIRFESILDGFNNYENSLLAPRVTSDIVECEENISSFLKSLYILNEKSLVVDFYLSKLSKDEFEKLYDSLSGEDKEILLSIKNSNFKSNYFLVRDEEVIDFFTRLCTRELFFITFYFKKYPLTIWGNYDLKFPMFYRNKEDINIYMDLIEENNLKIIT